MPGHRLGRLGTLALLGRDGGGHVLGDGSIFGSRLGHGRLRLLLLRTLGSCVNVVQLEDILQEVAMLRVDGA